LLIPATSLQLEIPGMMPFDGFFLGLDFKRANKLDSLTF
jgi:hypothetical protein